MPACKSSDARGQDCLRDARAEKRSGLTLPDSSPKHKKCCHENAQAKFCPYQERIGRVFNTITEQSVIIQSFNDTSAVRDILDNERLQEHHGEKIILFTRIHTLEQELENIKAMLRAAEAKALADALCSLSRNFSSLSRNLFLIEPEP
jgi:hypothetical protein